MVTKTFWLKKGALDPDISASRDNLRKKME